MRGSSSAAQCYEQSWRAELQLEFARLRNKTVLVKRRQFGPLTVQRPFYPESGLCHVYLLHPPGGVVGGDELTVTANVGPESQALLTTPAAGKFYRSNGASATQRIAIHVASEATLEWLPQESIIYSGAKVSVAVTVDLADDARFIGWDIAVFGRPAGNEIFSDGHANLRWQIYCGGLPIFLERLAIDVEAFEARWGLQRKSACGTLFAYPAGNDTLAAVQAVIGDASGRGVTRIGNLLVCRALDDRCDRVRGFLEQVWATIRPAILRRHACAPRIWAT